jgi:Hydrazine synthase alpha subunit middle domain
MRRQLWTTAALAALALTACTTAKSSEQSVLPGVNGVVFVKRAYLREDGSHEVASGMGQVFDYGRYNPGEGSGLYVLEPPTPDGKLRNLTEKFQGVDINGLDLSFDAKKVVFSMRTADDDHYHVYLANVDGSGEVQQLTFHDADDVQPVFLAGGRIAFVTNQPYTEMGTRADEYNHSRAVTQLATISTISGDADRRLCSHNLSNHTSPFAMSNGLVGFSRWEHLGPTNDVKLFTMRPDCTQMRALAGQHDKPFNSIVQVREVKQGELIGVATSRSRTIQSGALMQVKVPVRDTAEGSALPQFDEQHATFENITLSVPTDEAPPPTGVGRYRSPHVLPGESRVLVSWADGDVNDRNEVAETAPNFGLYLYDPSSGKRKIVYDDPKLWDLYAIPVAKRDEPPVLASINEGAYDANTPAEIGSIDVRTTSLEEQVSGGQFDGTSLADALKQTQRVRVIEGFSSEIGSVGQFGLTMHEGAAILGEAQVHQDGSWRAQIPPYLPVHLQPIDRFDLSIRNQLLWIQAMPGESRVCGGCHESRTSEIDIAAPVIAQQKPPAKLVKPMAERVELPWYGAVAGSTQVQDVLDRRCASCHSGGANDPFAGQTYTVTTTLEDGTTESFDIPVLDLSSRPINARYERETVTYPASYVSLLYPSAMMGNMRIEGTPTEWVVPGNARASRFIAKMNVDAVSLGADGTLSTPATPEWAFSGKPHPEDVGGEMSREDRVTLIRAIDLGGQYYSRRNVDGGQFTGETYEP